MCVMYVNVGSKARSISFGCDAMDSEVLFILRSRWLVYAAGSGVNRVLVVLSGFSVILFCFCLCNYGCMYFFAALVLVCEKCDDDLICVGHDLNWCSGWW